MDIDINVLHEAFLSKNDSVICELLKEAFYAISQGKDVIIKSPPSTILPSDCLRKISTLDELQECKQGLERMFNHKINLL
jgi:hypothetical protein